MPARRRIRDGDNYTIEEEERGEVEIDEPEPRRNAPPENTRGEAWGWTKDGPKPRGWRADGLYDGRTREEHDREEAEGRDYRGRGSNS
jgi:hypothetical protein